MYLFELYQHYTKLKKVDAIEPPGALTLPETWTTTFIKDYPRFPTITLPSPQPPETKLTEALKERRSSRTLTSPLTLAELSTLLFYSIGEKDKDYNNQVGKRMYPSAGARFPLEFYVAIFSPVESLKTGIYHYNVAKHGLTILKEMDEVDLREAPITTYEFAKKSQMGIISTAIFSRSAIKYGERAYRFSLLEAGTTAQNFGLVATSLNINSVIVGGIIDETWEDWLDIDGASEAILYGMFFG